MNKEPAFPALPIGRNLDNGFIYQSAGLTMRDYFAAKAMGGMCSYAPMPQESELEIIAKRSYKMADEMLRAREQ